jgi:hypothetical protein
LRNCSDVTATLHLLRVTITWNHTESFRSDKLPWCCQRGIDTHFGSYVNVSETLRWRRGGRRSSTKSFANFDILTGSEIVTMKLSSKNANPDMSTSSMCMSLCHFKMYFTCVSKTCFIYNTFLKVGDDMIPNLTFYSLFTVLILFVIHYTCNYLSNAPFCFSYLHIMHNQQNFSSSIFQRIKKKSF